MNAVDCTDTSAMFLYVPKTACRTLLKRVVFPLLSKRIGKREGKKEGDSKKPPIQHVGSRLPHSPN